MLIKNRILSDWSRFKAVHANWTAIYPLSSIFSHRMHSTDICHINESIVSKIWILNDGIELWFFPILLAIFFDKSSQLDITSNKMTDRL